MEELRSSLDPKVNTGYRLPASLVARIRVLAAQEGNGVWPCHVAERLLRRGLEGMGQATAGTANEATSN